MRKPGLWAKNDKKIQILKECTKTLSGLSPLQVKNKMTYVVGKIHIKGWNKEITCPVNK